MMGPRLKRQYAHHARRVDDSLTRNPIWRYIAIGSLPRRATPYFPGRSVGDRTDAQGLGRIAAAHTLTGPQTLSLHLPNWITLLAQDPPSESPIFLYELCAAVSVGCNAPSWPLYQHRTCGLCFDNQAAVAALFKGLAPATLGALLFILLWSLESRGPTLWRFEYTNAKSNIADPPSLICSLALEHPCVARVGHFLALFAKNVQIDGRHPPAGHSRE